MTSQKYIGIEWRNFHIRDVDIDTVKHSVSECGKAYATVYKGTTCIMSQEELSMTWNIFGRPHL